MKKNFCLMVCICFLSVPCFGHGDDAGFEVKHEEIIADENVVKTLGIQTQKIEENIAEETIKTTGQIEEIPKNHFDVNSPVQGMVVSVLVDLGDEVRIGQPLVTIQSTEIAKLESDLNQFKAEFELAKSNYEREKALFEQGISSKKDFEASKAIVAAASAVLNTAKSNLKIFTGYAVSPEQGTFTIKANRAGIITERNVAVGQVVNSSQILFRGAELSTVWASADIYEKDVNKIKLGQMVSVTLDGTPDVTYEGKLTYVGSVLNKESRTLPVKATLINKGMKLKSGIFIQLEFYTGQKKKSIVIPRTALVEMDKEGVEGRHNHIVYLKKKDKFIPKTIEVKSHDSNSVAVISGLMPGEILVTQGAYQLQYGEGEDKHEHAKEERSFSLWGIVILVFFALFVGFLFGRRKSK